ncbi:SusD/RagB family nutrient-binding outer membrane lipoprotein [Chryseobacterium sp.]|uniref:SusD/RagB family nutrient-binding outer membrane lipoprotein n=1 Tax=Chryseobacterium sp. TaxID=1871047 RepID=UPI0011CCBB10|nr:SusD/RagB family nutrient-binding outer membrane lipoprotein [Chryseobacterium sp.]TXF77359.1 SusD/RagB family nutrient-binding outer membrane lipoprotein [Chryseobacterium sp.]
MKKIRIFIFGLVAAISIISCNDQLDINRDPDNLSPEQIPLNSEFSGASTGVATSAGSYYALIGGFWSQYFTQSAAANQYKEIDNYSINTGDYNGAWSSMYDAILDLRNVKKNAETSGNWNYYLMSTVMEAYAFQVLTDSYGAVPFTEATNSEILAPKFDEPAIIYDGLVANLKLALSKDLSSSSTTVIPGGDDLVFGGDMERWKRFANTMLLKLYIRQTNSRPSVAQAGIQQLYSSGAQFLTTDAAITQYEDQANKSNPLYETDRRQLNVGTNLRASTTLYSYLSDNNDPRMPLFYTSGPSQDQGDFDNTANVNAAVIKLQATDPVYFISAAESYFLQAEASVRYNGGTNAKNLYDMGVNEAFSQWGLSPGALLTGDYAFPVGTNPQLEAILTQKWISFFPGKGYEAFFEQKRTKIPEISSVPQSSLSYIPGQFAYSVEGTTNGLFPRRIVYPVSESQTNANFPGLKPITDALWYDAN